MRNTEYNITCRNPKTGKPETRTVKGRIFNYSGVRFGMSRDTWNANGAPLKHCAYILTELTTGYSCGFAFEDRTQKGVISRLTGDAGKKYLHMIRTAVEKWTTAGNADANAGIIPAEDVLTV